MTTRLPSAFPEVETPLDSVKPADSWASGQSQHHLASISDCRQPREHSKDRHLPPLFRSLPGGVSSSDVSHLSPNLSNPCSPFSRRDSLRKRFSFGPSVHGARISFSGLLLHQPTAPIRLENTYCLEPEPGCAFNASQTQLILQATLDSYLNGAQYSPNSCSQLSQVLAEVVRAKVKDVCPSRYKLVCHVAVGQTGDNSFLMASRCLHDSERDNFASAAFQNNSLFAVVVVHGLYFE
ncbi:tctex1 domain-containing protein 1 [Denticeps clupeoides]|uniref:TC1D4 protein n=1 Tax=Denticeps clupeoides TaxID=299321 RepID=A0AAY4A2I9_9TELE|nr:tctex1 domain-containing protein 4 [Denticeps clupeoides]XP_028834016.1 tctex1 domain-containing protein 4 [Denticeps clupeoides]XP_028834017.1 tctex1 domain-containing protein 4 [Denticeps clupeoides]